MPAIRFALLISCVPVTVHGQIPTAGHDTPPSAYAGEERRAIKSLSQEDLAEIARGGGWGLARAAELNNVPGPTHLLELADALGLSQSQRAGIEAIRAQMQADAIVAGAGFVAAERALNAAFQDGIPDAATLNSLVGQAGTARAALRLIHLNAHLQTLPLLTKSQIAEYAVLRGYAETPCAAVPDGHDPDMWRKHNGCQ